MAAKREKDTMMMGTAKSSLHRVQTIATRAASAAAINLLQEEALQAGIAVLGHPHDDHPPRHGRHRKAEHE